MGETLKHSFSPLIHSYLGDYLYELFEVRPDDLESFMAERRFDGINVTIPYKQAVTPFCSSLSAEARAIGSVNTIVKGADGRLHGHNTDAYGFRVMMERAGIDPGGKKTLVLGDGGSARTVRHALAGMGAREVVTISRRGVNNYGNISMHYDADVIINTTPVGMYPGNGSSPLPLSGFARLRGVADLIYNPARTRLLLEAERLGIPRVNGLAMLAAQAEMASGLFLDAPPRPGLTDGICDNILKKTLNVVLIGMPGCGKSTAGRALAKLMGRPFTDVDESIAAAAGKSIPLIFEEDGEEETKKSGCVIATGGGAVTRPENLGLMRQNGAIVYLRCELDRLSTDGRPVSQNVGIRAIAERRLPLYDAWGDYVIQVEDDAEVTAKKILGAIK